MTPDSPPELSLLAARVDRAERGARRARAMALVASAIALAALLVPLATDRAVAPAGIVTAQEVRVVGAEGDTRATLGVGPDGTPYLAFRHRDGMVRVGMGVPSDGLPSLVLLDAAGQVRFMAP